MRVCVCVMVSVCCEFLSVSLYMCLCVLKKGCCVVLVCELSCDVVWFGFVAWFVCLRVVVAVESSCALFVIVCVLLYGVVFVDLMCSSVFWFYMCVLGCD